MPGLIGEDQVRTVAEAALDLDGVDGVEVLFMHEWGGLSRFADSAIHQSTWREDTAVRTQPCAKHMTDLGRDRPVRRGELARHDEVDVDRVGQAE